MLTSKQRAFLRGLANPLPATQQIGKDGVTEAVCRQAEEELAAKELIKLRVLESVNLVAVTVNPFSAYGFHFDKDELMERMQQRVDIPVINVEDNAV